MIAVLVPRCTYWERERLMFAIWTDLILVGSFATVQLSVDFRVVTQKVSLLLELVIFMLMLLVFTKQNS